MSSQLSPEEAAAAAAAAAEAFHQFSIEIWTLYSFALASTLLRTYARLRAAGLSGLRAEDLFVWLGIVFYTGQTSLAYNISNLARGMANNGMTDAQRAALVVGSEEYNFRVAGSKIQVAGWTIYSTMMWLLKISMLFFYTRLTDGLGQAYRIRVHIGFVLVITTFLVTIITIFTACRPFYKYWQINPDPGNVCQGAVSRAIVWASFAANVSTDIYLIAIPLPMLWKSTLKLPKKLASSVLLGAGIFVLVCAILKTYFVLADPENGAQLAGSWGIREAFVAVNITNLPVTFPLIKTWLTPLFGTLVRSSQQKSYQTPPGFRTIGGGRGVGESQSRSRSRRGPPSVNPITGNLSFADSEEKIVDDVKMNNLRVYATSESPDKKMEDGIVVSNEVEITREDRSSHNSLRAQGVREMW